jgi:hypothetical protein
MLKPERFAKLAASHVFVSPIEAKIKKCSKWEAKVIQGLATLSPWVPVNSNLV